MTALVRGVRADELTTRTATWRAFIRHGSPRLLLTAAAASVVVRVGLGDLQRSDVLVIVVTVVLIGPFEWIVHRHLLHAPSRSFRARRLGTGTGHAEHHRDPHDLGWLLLTWQDAAIFACGIGLLTASWSAPIGGAFGSSPQRAALSAWSVGLIALAHYEWTHLLVHTRYRCRSRYYRELARHHRLHHYRNEDYWLGVTTTWADRVAGTMPERGDVSPSPTTRSVSRR